MEEDKDKGPSREVLRWERVTIALAVLIVVVSIVGVTRWSEISSKKHIAKDTRTVKVFKVEISGAIAEPGTYELLPGDTLHELVTMAGGFDEWANTGAVDFTTPLDESVRDVYIPFADDYQQPKKPPKPKDVDFPININIASAYELQALPHIGPKLAERIVDYRERNGPFEKASEIMNVDGIGPKKYEELFGLITVGDKLKWD